MYESVKERKLLIEEAFLRFIALKEQNAEIMSVEVCEFLDRQNIDNQVQGQGYAGQP